MTLGNPPDAPESHPDSRHLDSAALKAYAHPLRLAILRYLHGHGAATSTTLARHLGESTGQTSYHLRQLARHGIVEDIPERGTGRERWWRPASVTIDAQAMLEDEATAAAAALVLGDTVRERAETLATWMSSLTAPDRAAWLESAIHFQSTIFVTPAELEEIGEELTAIVTRAAVRFRDRKDGPAPAGTSPVRLYVDGFPLLAPGEPGA